MHWSLAMLILLSTLAVMAVVWMQSWVRLAPCQNHSSTAVDIDVLQPALFRIPSARKAFSVRFQGIPSLAESIYELQSPTDSLLEEENMTDTRLGGFTEDPIRREEIQCAHVLFLLARQSGGPFGVPLMRLMSWNRMPGNEALLATMMPLERAGIDRKPSSNMVPLSNDLGNQADSLQTEYDGVQDHEVRMDDHTCGPAFHGRWLSKRVLHTALTTAQDHVGGLSPQIILPQLLTVHVNWTWHSEAVHELDSIAWMIRWPVSGDALARVQPPPVEGYKLVAIHAELESQLTTIRRDLNTLVRGLHFLSGRQLATGFRLVHALTDCWVPSDLMDKAMPWMRSVTGRALKLARRAILTRYPDRYSATDVIPLTVSAIRYRLVSAAFLSSRRWISWNDWMLIFTKQDESEWDEAADRRLACAIFQALLGFEVAQLAGLHFHMPVTVDQLLFEPIDNHPPQQLVWTFDRLWSGTARQTYFWNASENLGYLVRMDPLQSAIQPSQWRPRSMLMMQKSILQSIIRSLETLDASPARLMQWVQSLLTYRTGPLGSYLDCPVWRTYQVPPTNLAHILRVGRLPNILND